MSDLQRRCVRWSLLCLVSSSLAACGSFDTTSNRLASIVTPYKIDIVQGNFVSKEQADALKPGMSRGQVRDILGTPLLTSIFHAERWDYVFTFRRQGVEPQARKLTVFFNGEVMARVQADELPTEAEFVAALDSGRQALKVPVLVLSDEELKQLPVPAKALATKSQPALPSSYPPLEAAAH